MLRATGLTLLSSPDGRARDAGRTTLHDRRSPLPDAPGSVLLVADQDPDEVLAGGIVEAAAERGCGALVIKTYGVDPTPVIQVADTSGVALLAVPDDLDWLQLASLVNAALDSLAHSGQGAPAVGDLFALANAIATSVGGATAIEDFQQRVLAYSNVPGQPIDPERREGILGRQVPKEPGNPDQYRALYRTSGVVHFEAEPPALPRLAVAVRAGSEPLGSIWVVDADGLSDDSERSLVAAADIAALHLLRERSAEDLARRQRAELLHRLLESRSDPDRAVTQLGLDPSGPFVVLGFEAVQRTDDVAQLFRVVDLVTLRAESRVGRAACALVGTTVYALVSGNRVRDEDALVRFCQDAVGSARESLRLQLLAAVGSPAERPGGLASSRGDADRALQLLHQHGHLGPVTSSRRTADQLALLGLADVLATRPDLVSAKAVAVRAHDAAHGTAYEKVLATWLDRQRDVAATAARLSLHPNTVRYRVRRATELFGLDPRDPDEVLVLWLSLRSRGRSEP